MKKGVYRIGIALLLVVLGVGCTPESVTDAERMGYDSQTYRPLVGSVERMKITFSRGERVGEEYQPTRVELERLFEFNKAGDLARTEERNYRPDGKLLSRVEREYDAHGLEQQALFYNAEERLTARSQYRYNESGLRTGEVRLNPSGGANWRMMIDCDTLGRPLRGETQMAGGRVTERSVFTYAEDGSSVERIERYRADTLYAVLTRRFDNRDFEVERLYDGPAGLRVEEPFRTTFQRNDAGELVEKYTYSEQGELLVCERYERDAQGTLQERLGYRADTLLHHYRYLYRVDSYGNLIQEVTWDVMQGSVHRMITREITYR